MSARFTTGRLRRRCADCELEVDLAKPAVVLNAEATRNTRKTYSDLLRYQLPWPLMCPSCTVWWNAVLRSILTPPSE